MTRIINSLLCLAFVLPITPVVTQAAGLPLVLSTSVDAASNTVRVNGQNFGSAPLVTLNNLSLPTVSASSSQIIAHFPSGAPLSGFNAGSYLLVVQFRNQLPTIFTVSLGATGPQGPQGAPGPQGPAGPRGATGLAGPQGMAGPMGMSGPAGPTGAQGLQGLTGPAGSNGAPGAAGPQGPRGPAGSAAITCPSGSTTPTAPGGSYIDCGDGTLIDVRTNLMWEKKSGTVGLENLDDWHDVNNRYVWSTTGGGHADGPLFTHFLANLNLTASLTTDDTCFAGHCDWRIPNIQELQSIQLMPYPCGTNPCIDPAFGPIADVIYWSSTQAQYATSVFSHDLYFGLGLSGTHLQDKSFAARAVRGGR